LKLFEKIIRHENNMDVCYLVVKCYESAFRYYIKAEILNMGYESTYSLGIHCRIKIDKEDIHKWWICNDPYAQCVRYAEWQVL